MEEQVLWVTGGTSGIGAAIARRAVEAGHRTFVPGRNGDRLRSLLDEGANQSGWPVGCGGGQRRLHSAGRLRHRRPRPVARHGVDQCLRSGAHRQGVPTHVLDTKGSVMLVGSVAGTPMVPGSLYGATKAAVHAMGENLRARLVGTGVHVSVIRPGRVEAPFWESAPDIALESADIAAAVLWILERPAGADVNELRMRPIGQER